MRKNKKFTFWFLNIFLILVFLFIIDIFKPIFFSVVLANDFYIFDVRNYLFSRWCYSVDQCSIDQPPPGKNFTDLINNFDILTFLVSLQGLINREEKRFLLISSDIDIKWLTKLKEYKLFPPNLNEKFISDIRQAIFFFQSSGMIKGSVVWDAQKPFTLNLAFSLAGAENLVIVRKGSSLYHEITSAFPVVIDLSSQNFPDKDSAYQWLIDNYLKTGKLSPILFLIDDGWPIYKYLYLQKVFLDKKEITNWNLLGRDIGVSKKAFFFDLGINPQMKDPVEMKTGVDYNTATKILNEIKNRIGNNIFESWGWPPLKYMIYGCGGGDEVSCGEWYWIKKISEYGGVQRLGLGEMFAKEPANFSFYSHTSLKTDLISQPPPMDIKQLLAQNYLIGYPLNYSFELGDNNWVLETTNRVIYDEPKNASQGRKFLQVNVSESDKGKSIYQDFSCLLKRGYRYRFVIFFRSPNGSPIQGRQVVWGWPSQENARLLCYNQFNRNNTEYQPLICEFDVQEDNLNKIRIQIYIDTPWQNYSFDEAYFFGPNCFILNPNKKFLMFYQGDDDMSTPPYLVRTGVSPYTWYDQSNFFTTGWGLTTELAKTLPIIWDFFANTKPNIQTWVMPDSGMGYANIIPMPLQNLDSWIKETALYQRKFQYRTGWILEGFNWQEVPFSSKVANYGKKVAPEGVFYNSPPDGIRTINNGLPVIPMTDFSWAGDNIEERAHKLKEITTIMNSYQKKFLVLRNVFVSDKHLEEIVDRSRQLGGDFEVLNPLTFLYLYQLSFNQYPSHRLSVISHNIPSIMKKGVSYSIKMTIRNDGWAIWSPSNISVIPEGGGDYKLAYGYQLKNQFSPSGKEAPVIFPYHFRVNIGKVVMPGEEIEINFNITAPNEENNYVFQFDGVKEYFEFFENNGNVPWLKEIFVTSNKNFLFFYLVSNQNLIDLNFDDKINSLDFLLFRIMN